MPGPLVGFFAGSLFGRFLQIVLMATIGRIILAFGISVVTFTGVNIAVNVLKSGIQNAIASAPADAITLLQMGGFINAINMMLAAVTAVVTIKTVTGTMRSLSLIPSS